MKRGEKLHKKRGLSPVIASTFLILLVLVLASLIFLWARGFISEQIEKFGQPIENLCNSLDFDVTRASTNTGIDVLEVINRGNTDIYNLEIKMFDDKGNSETSKFKFEIPAGEAVSEEVYLRLESGVTPEKVEVYPALIGTVQGKPLNKVFTCTEVGKTI